MFKTAVLGYPRIGKDRELKKAVEAYWNHEISAEVMESVAVSIRQNNWQAMRMAGIEVIPSNDFSLYDQMLDMTALLGAVPSRYSWKGGLVDLDTYFAMARGKKTIPALELTKWFDTNYHYLVPELYPVQRFKISSDKPFREYKQALSLGIRTRPVLIGPITYLLLAKSKPDVRSVWSVFDALVKTYVDILKEFSSLGVEAVQMDEPGLVLDLGDKTRRYFKKAYGIFARETPEIGICLATYFGGITHQPWALSLPVAGIHVDLAREPRQLATILRKAPPKLQLSLGVIDGRNIWKNDFDKTLKLLASAAKKRPAETLQIATSCSLLHTPIDLDAERRMDGKSRRWFSFAKQKLSELKILQRALREGTGSVRPALEENRKEMKLRAHDPRVRVLAVRRRTKKLRVSDFRRKNSFRVRQALQRSELRLPLFPTTTIGSFPQTAEIRKARADFKKGQLSSKQYESFLKLKTRQAVRKQEVLGLDVLVHGEFERNDMVEYFGERLDGFLFTENGWVQSYGTRCVKPPVIYGDVRRVGPMTLDWTRYAQSLTPKPVKGMLTGPITILQWSFVRDDQTRSATAQQIALAIRDEVQDLERQGTGLIQIDEPAIREGLPLRKKEQRAYLRWAVNSFRLSSAGVKDQTQIHTHMCYSEFNEIFQAIAAMDADVISIEASRSQMELLDAFAKFRYPNEIGPGVYDIHSPRVPGTEEIKSLLKKAARRIPARNLWVNPDCGLKTRKWEECLPALKAMVQAARALRKELKQ